MFMERLLPIVTMIVLSPAPGLIGGAGRMTCSEKTAKVVDEVGLGLYLGACSYLLATAKAVKAALAFAGAASLFLVPPLLQSREKPPIMGPGLYPKPSTAARIRKLTQPAARVLNTLTLSAFTIWGASIGNYGLAAMGSLAIATRLYK